MAVIPVFWSWFSEYSYYTCCLSAPLLLFHMLCLLYSLTTVVSLPIWGWHPNPT